MQPPFDQTDSIQSSVPGQGAVPEPTGGLNDDVPLPADGEPEILSNDIVGDSDTIFESLKALDGGTPAVANEGHYQQLSYLRDDLRNKRGMDRSIANEAMVLIPGFGKGKPVNHYSAFPSQTGYQASMEEIAGAMTDQLVTFFNGQAANASSLKPMAAYILENTKFQDRLDHFKTLAENLACFKAIVQSKDFHWEDKIYQASAVDPTQFSSIPEILTVKLSKIYSFLDCDDYYMTVVTAPILCEAMTTYLKQWSDVFHAFLSEPATVVDDKGKIIMPLPQFAQVFDRQGKEVKLEYAYDFFSEAAKRSVEPEDTYPLDIIVGKFSAVMEQANIQGITNRLKVLVDQADELGGVLKQAGDKFAGMDGVDPQCALYSDAGQKLITLFMPDMVALAKGVGQIQILVSQALITLNYVNMLVIRVVQIAWEEVQKCKDTMQMSEDEYNQLKAIAAHQLVAYKAVADQ